MEKTAVIALYFEEQRGPMGAQCWFLLLSFHMGFSVSTFM